MQAEIDAAAELIDFFRFNAKHAIELEPQQPLSTDDSTNTMLYRGLEVGSSFRNPEIDKVGHRQKLLYAQNGVL